MPVTLVYEAKDYFDRLVNGPAAGVTVFIHCEHKGTCSALDNTTKNEVAAVVGQPRDLGILGDLPNVGLLQSTSYFHSWLDHVPTSIMVAKYSADYQKAYGSEPIAEFVMAGVFEWNYRLRQLSATFTSCAWGADAPLNCPFPQELTSHPVLMGMTMGILGYGVLGEAVARRAAAMGMRTVATKRQGPFDPPPQPLTWLSDDNDRLFRESDFVLVAVPGETRHLINETSLALMKPTAVLIPLAAGPIDYDSLYARLAKHAIGGAIMDVWPEGCWSYPEVECGPPYGAATEPDAHEDLQKLDNVLALPGVAQRDAGYWANSSAFVADNLLAFMGGQTQAMHGIVRNASAVPFAHPSAAVVV